MLIGLVPVQRPFDVFLPVARIKVAYSILRDVVR